MSKKELELKLKRDSKLRDLREKPESLSINKSNRDLKPKDKQESRPKELNMKKESKWKDLSVRRDSKSIDLIKRESRPKEKLKLKP